MKKLIHQELKELIKHKSTSDSDVNIDPIDCDIKSTTSTMSHKTKKQIAATTTITNENDLLQIGHFLPRAKLKTTMQNFLQKQSPNVIYNSTLNHRNMRHVTPPPLPNLLHNVVHASYSNANSPTQDKCNFKSHMKSANMVFNSCTDSTDPWLHQSNEKLTKCEVDAFSQRYKETNNKIEEKNETKNRSETTVNKSDIC